MGILSALLGENNPAAQWAGQNQAFLGAIGSGLGQGQNIQSGLSAGLAQVPQAKMLDAQAAEKAKADAKVEAQVNATQAWLQQNHPDLAQMVEAGMPVSEAWQAAMDRMQPESQQAQTSDIQNYLFAQENPGFLDYQTQKGGAAERSLTPTFIKDANGNIVPGQLDKAGNLVPSKLPEGYQAVDPFAMAAGKTGATVDAKTAAGARAALPGAEQAVTIAKNAIGLIRNDEKGLNEQFGQVGPRNMFVLPGTALGNWTANFEQAKGQAFMQARQMLKGGGPITDYEGMKGEAAYSRMEQAARTGDKANFLRALDDFEAAVDQGYQKLVETAQGSYSQGGAAVPAAGGGNVDDILSKYGL